MYTKTGHLKQEIRCKSGIAGFYEITRFLNNKDIQYTHKTNESEVLHHVLELEDIYIVFAFDGYEGSKIVEFLTRRYGK